MHILVVVHSMAAGGAERVTANLANHWAARGDRVTVLTFAGRALDVYTLDPAVERLALNVARESSGALSALWNNVVRVVALRRELGRLQPDVALAMMTTSNVLLAIAGLGMKKAALVGSERTHPPQRPLGPVWEGLRRYWYGRLHAVSAQTTENRDWLLANTTAQDVPVIPNPVAWPFETNAPFIPPGMVVMRERKILLAAGRLTKAKGFDQLIEAFAAVAELQPTWDLVILGEGHLRNELETQIAARKLKSRVHMPGLAGNVSQWYRAAELYVMSSKYEGFPNTLLEALAHGLPAISFDCNTGPRDIIRHGIDGLLVNAGDVTALGDALQRLMSDDRLRGAMRQRAPEARDRFSLLKIAGMWDAVFVKALARSV